MPYGLVKKAAESRSSVGEIHDQGRPGEEDSNSPDPTTKIKATCRSLDARVVKSRNRRRGTDNQIVRSSAPVPVKSSESTTRQSSQTARVPGDGRKINEQKD
ncbi:hypothetical protein TNIN_319041 [Trichonephila inaurata madagascariensis]|uniref:Uncharacterized protein n=1 Tax=Trichonephila inaurata madagascariensis TaxID=2747483 RepID=A0A8X6MI50_9ARAC|nr:hypothetical protein TNIN_319041 [Trichonephila inaurata madagascariensis]